MYVCVCVCFFHPNKSVTGPAATMQKRRRRDFAKARGYPKLALYNIEHADNIYIYMLYTTRTLHFAQLFPPKMKIYIYVYLCINIYICTCVYIRARKTLYVRTRTPETPDNGQRLISLGRPSFVQTELKR